MSEILRLTSKFQPWYPLILGIAALILFFAILFIEHRVSRISRKLDRTNGRLEQVIRYLDAQTQHLEKIADAVTPEPPLHADPPPASQAGARRGASEDVAPRSPKGGPIEL